jgi:hypothetical protein
MPSSTARRRGTVTALPSPAPVVAAPDDPVAAFRAAAQAHALKALQALAWLVDNAGSEAVRVSAANALIDRAYGRAAQAVRVGGEGASEDGQVSLTFTWLDPAKS